MFVKGHASARLVTGTLVFLFAVWILQMAFTYFSFSRTEMIFGERMEKLLLAARLVELTSGRDLPRDEEEEMRSSANRLAELTRTAQGRELSRQMAAAVEEYLSRPSREGADRTILQELARQNDAFQRQRLKEEVFFVQGDFGRLFAVVATASGGTFLISAFLLILLQIWLLGKMETIDLVNRNTRNAVLVSDRRGRITLANPAFAALAGQPAGELSGRPLEAAGPTGALLARRLKNGEEVSGREVLWQTPDGATKCFSVDVVLLKNKKNRVQGGMAVLRDITAQWLKRQKDEEEKAALKEMARHDGLTGLINHRALMEELEIMAQKAFSDGRPLALLMLDMDYFKIYNDTLGHPAGDSLLAEFAGLLAKNLRAQDLAARYGGDEFVVALPDTDGVGAYQIAERLRRIIADHPFPGREVLPGGSLTVSIGVATTTSAGIDSAGALVKAADEALYAAKLGTRNRTELYHSALAELKEVVPKEQREALLVAVRTNLLFLHMRDQYTYNHSERVAGYSRIIAKNLGIRPEEVRTLRIGAVLHDIGKVCVQPYILTKKEPLCAWEWEELKKHPQHGAGVLAPFYLPRPVTEIVLHHHERYDGTGYPAGLKGDKIPLFARIASVADAFDAMTVDRPYRRALSLPEALAELRRCAGSQFDPEIVGSFVQAVNEGAGREIGRAVRV
ncbi:MAG: diguanylate cyclase [Firmicutes bacterium]|nr:diguanylate cyclase [Bacillota bacterium]